MGFHNFQTQMQSHTKPTQQYDIISINVHSINVHNTLGVASQILHSILEEFRKFKLNLLLPGTSGTLLFYFSLFLNCNCKIYVLAVESMSLLYQKGV